MIEKKIVIGNWKMNPASAKEAIKIYSDILKKSMVVRGVDIIITPPIIYLDNLKGKSRKVILGAQDCFYGKSGAHTGEVSAEMLREAGAKYVILGHSERRARGEDNEMISQKVKAVLSSLLTPVLCVGEIERDETHKYLSTIKEQLEEGLSMIPKTAIGKVVIAYEPVWAIGKTALREATPEEFREMKIFIKKVLSDRFGSKNVEKVKILYGGSAHPNNVASFLLYGEADGFLVGRDSLKPEKFVEILKLCEASKN